MITKILVALDFSPTSQNVAKYATALAKKFDATVVLSHVVADTAYYAMDYMPVEGFSSFNLSNAMLLNEEVHEHARQFLENMKAEMGYEKTETVLLEGNIKDALLECAQNYNCDLIVTGAHHHTGLVKLLEGDTAAKILQKSHIPILIIPEAVEEEK